MGYIKYWAFLCENQEDRPNFFLDDSNIFPFDEVYEDISNNNLEKFVQKLNKKPVKFRYLKKSDNTYRTAYGTLNKNIMSKDGMKPNSKIQYHHKAGRYSRYPNIVVYWDLDQHMWRCFDKRNFIRTLH